MGYFADHYAQLSYPIEDLGRAGMRAPVPGFRLAQIAAIQSVASHFFSSMQRAIVTMPTGSGKTTILCALPFILRANRVLVLTPSRLVREQIADNFRILRDLKLATALPHDLIAPRVFSTERRVGSEEAWENLRAYDVVVATVPSVSPQGEVIPAAPPDLFDLVLVDEAHHAAAQTWAALLDLLQSAKQVLFTATPYRRDEKEIRGRFVFTYHLKRARADGVFGDLRYEAVNRGQGLTVDQSIARATAARFEADRAAGFRHLVMVRVDTTTRAKELLELYHEETNLRLRFVSGAHTLAHVRRIIAELDAGELDGIVCVNMFGEGFNMPRLKIAAIHSPHRSIAITLQFIGRFARVGGANLGPATFLAEPRESSDELTQLYESGAEWRDLVQDLAGAKIDEQTRIREVIDSFDTNAIPEMDDFSLYTLRPYFHVKIFRAPDAVSFQEDPDFPKRSTVIYKAVSENNNTAVYITREAKRALWSTDERFTNVEFDLHILHHNVAAGLLFLCSTRRDERIYGRIVKHLFEGRARPLTHAVVSRALNDLERAEFFSLGMRKRHLLGRVESYRTLTGPSAARAVMRSDARSFDRGHVFGKGINDGQQVTIGVSPLSKVWSNSYEQIPDFIEWCDTIADKIQSGQATPTGSNLDFLSSGEELREITEPVIALAWRPHIYLDPPLVSYMFQGQAYHSELIDFDLTVDAWDRQSVSFSISNAHIRWQGVFQITQGELFAEVPNVQQVVMFIHDNDEDVAVAEYLNASMPNLYTASFGRIDGLSIYRAPEEATVLDMNACEAVPWPIDLDITKEKPNGLAPRSIFEWLEARLRALNPAVLFCDDGAGEICDFVAVFGRGNSAEIHFYHCKASERAQPGERVDDLYDVCGQAIKSSVWFGADQLINRLEYRRALRSIRGYLIGTQADLAQVLRGGDQQLAFHVYIVQPGVRTGNLTPGMSNLLAAASDYVTGGGADKFGVIGS